MNINLDQLKAYEIALAAGIENLANAKRQIEYNRLQAKQTRAKIKQAKQSALIKLFIAKMPIDSVKITPAPDQIYVSVTLNYLEASLYGEVPEELGLKLWRDEPSDKSLGGFAGADLKVWRTPHEPGVFFYIQNHWK